MNVHLAAYKRLWSLHYFNHDHCDLQMTHHLGILLRNSASFGIQKSLDLVKRYDWIVYWKVVMLTMIHYRELKDGTIITAQRMASIEDYTELYEYN